MDVETINEERSRNLFHTETSFTDQQIPFYCRNKDFTLEEDLSFKTSRVDEEVALRWSSSVPVFRKVNKIAKQSSIYWTSLSLEVGFLRECHAT